MRKVLRLRDMFVPFLSECHLPEHWAQDGISLVNSKHLFQTSDSSSDLEITAL